MRIHLTKVTEGVLSPSDEEAHAFIGKVKVGETVFFDIKKSQNYKFHKKLFTLLNFLYAHWEPAELQDPKWEGVVPKKSFDQFREDITILAGFYDALYRVDGSVRIVAKSIAYSKMSQEEKEQLYSNIIDVGLEKILVNYNKEELDAVMRELLGFT